MSDWMAWMENGGIFQKTKGQWRIPITVSWLHATYSYMQSVTAIDQITGKTILFYFLHWVENVFIYLQQ
jgi:Tfp pilus assembly protein PilZ